MVLTGIELNILEGFYYRDINGGRININDYPLNEGENNLRLKEFSSHLMKLERIGYLKIQDALVSGGRIDSVYNNSVVAIIFEKIHITKEGIEYIQQYLKEKTKETFQNDVPILIKKENEMLTDNSSFIVSNSSNKQIGSNSRINLKNRQEISKWAREISEIVENNNTKFALDVIGRHLQGKFDAQWSSGNRERNSVHLYAINDNKTIYAYLKVENDLLKSQGPRGINYENGHVVPHECMNETKKLTTVNDKNAFKFINILLKALGNKPIEDDNNNGEISPIHQITEITSDTCSGPDLLNIEKDVTAVANLIASRNLNTPLSIGLFGNWGSGKSFFMGQIQRKLNEISFKSRQISEKNKNNKSVSSIELQYNELFCEDIIHINFNAWHYADANLWASLVSHIFNNISHYLNKTDENSEVVNQIKLPFLKELATTKAFEKELEEKKRKLNMLHDENVLELNRLQNILKEKKIVNIRDIVENIMENQEVKNKFKEEFPDSREMDEKIQNLKEASDGFFEILNDTKGIIKQTCAIWRKLKRKSKIEISALSLLIVFLLFGLPIYKVTVNEVINLIINITTRFISISIPIIGLINNRNIKNARKKVKEWLSFIEELASKQEKELKNQEIKYILEISDIEKEIKEVEKTKGDLCNKIKSIESKIEDIDNNYIDYFIKNRINSGDYTKHLGLINLVRKDFEVLSEYLKNPKLGTCSKIDRIVLYIDDLDRCQPEMVVEVLQAINLILAFELFVVIVSVDVRWISNCLFEKYKAMFRKDNNSIGASSYDYLEKIFQLPIKMHAVSCENSKQYINRLLEVNNHPFHDSTKNQEYISLRSNLTNTVQYEKALEEFLELKDTDNIVMKSDIEVMQISEEDIEKIYEFVPILGNTPRTIKRFVNIFRILKANNSVISENQREALFLLAVTTGLPNISLKLLKIISDSSETDYKKLLINVDISLFNSKIEMYELERLKEFMKNTTNESFAMEKYKVLIPNISRYSFYLEELI